VDPGRRVTTTVQTTRTLTTELPAGITGLLLGGGRFGHVDRSRSFEGV